MEAAPQSFGVGETLRHPEFRMGMRAMAGLGLGIAAWGLVTGVAMVKGGMSVPLAIFMSLAVYAGSAQLAVMPLMAAGAPLWVIWLTATCVNLRFVIFSTMWRAYFQHLPRWRRLMLGYFSGDVIYVAFMQRYPEPVILAEQQPYFWGAATTNWLAWQVPSIAGILLANVVPLHWGLGFAGVLALLGVLLSLLYDRATWITTGISATAAVAAFALPLKLNILVAIAAAVAVGLGIEAMERRSRGRERLPTLPGSSPAPAAASPAAMPDAAPVTVAAVVAAAGPGRPVAAAPVESATSAVAGARPSEDLR